MLMSNTKKALTAVLRTLDEVEELVRLNPESEAITEKAERVKTLMRSVRGRRLTEQEARLLERARAQGRRLVEAMLDMVPQPQL